MEVDFSAPYSGAGYTEDSAPDGARAPLSRTVQCGDRVRVRLIEISVLEVVPSGSTPGDGQTSTASPIGGALLGARAGSSFDVDTPGGTLTVDVVSIVDGEASQP